MEGLHLPQSQTSTEAATGGVLKEEVFLGILVLNRHSRTADPKFIAITHLYNLKTIALYLMI